MAEIPGYENDIFISYTHDDNAQIGNNPGWVDIFYESLENWLIKRRGLKKLKIWRDEKQMRGNTQFDLSIEKTLKSTALFFVLHSHNYRDSQYCQKELEWFVQHNQHLLFGDKSRIFNILLKNIPHQQWPKPLHGNIGFPMHDAKDEALGDFTSPYDQLFEKQLRKIVDAVEEIVKDYTPAQPLPDASESEQKEVRIFIAHAADTLDDFRERIRTEAEEKQVIILDEIPPPMEYEDHKQRLRQTLEQAHFSIHLFDNLAGRKIKDHRQTTYPHEQFDIALSGSAQMLVWTPKNLTIDDEKQRTFIQKITDSQRSSSQYELITSTETDFIHALFEKIEEYRSASISGPVTNTYLVDTHQKDQRYAFKLADFLDENGALVEFNMESKDPNRSLMNFEQSVRHVKNLIIIFGIVGSTWLNRRIEKVIRVIAEQMTSHEPLILEKIWVYVTPKCKGDVSLHDFPHILNIEILDNRRSEEIDQHELAKLLPFPSGAGGPQ